MAADRPPTQSLFYRLLTGGEGPMPIQTSQDSTTRNTASSIFSRVLVGVDGSTAGSEAARQAGLVLAPEGELTVLGAFDVMHAFVGDTVGMTPSVRIDSAARGAAESVVARAVDALPGATSRSCAGRHGRG